jgi:GNAT superfamily N-acetyltransferase
MGETAIRELHPEELEEVASFTKLASGKPEGCACSLVAVRETRIVGYAEMAPTFFRQNFILLLSVHSEHRRQGVATALMKAVEARCRNGKLFTSTNLSNQPMQALLGKIGYRLCGVVEDLDEGDPELIFVKRLTAPPASRY